MDKGQVHKSEWNLQSQENKMTKFQLHLQEEENMVESPVLG